MFRFDRVPIPAGFISSRAEEFAKPVIFRGRPLGSQYFRGAEITHVDTVVERKGPVDLRPPYPCSKTIPIELAGLALESTEPIEVRIGQRVEAWNVQVDLSSAKSSAGTMTITKTSKEGGVFDSELTVFPVFRFTRTCDGKEKILDTGSLPLPPELVAKMAMRSYATPWRHEVPGTLRISGLNDNFVAGAPGLFREDGESCAHPVNEAPECKVIIIASSRCLCVGSERAFTARGSPDGESYVWSITQGASRAVIVGGGTSRHVDVRGTSVSSAANDIRLHVVYRPPGGGSCSASIGLTTLEATLTLRTSGIWNPDNDIPQDARLGVPQLGPVSPGNPTGTAGFFKNIEIEATIRPNAPSLPCSFDFKRTREGREGVLTPNGNFLPGSLDCPTGPCDDDASNADEDLTLSAAGTIYDADSPGLFFDPPACTQQVQGAIRVSCLNFRNWLEIDGQRCGDIILWHAHTRVRCDNGTWVETTSAVGPGHITCTAGGAVQPRRPLPIPEAVRLLESASLDDRAEGYRLVANIEAAGGLDASDHAELVRELTRIVRARGRDELAAPTMVAIQLLGLLRAEGAVPDLIHRVLGDFQQPHTSALPTPAAQALKTIGLGAVPAIVERADVAADDEWRILERVLRSFDDQAAVRRAVCARLDSEPGQVAEKRLDHYLRLERRVHSVQRSVVL